MSFSFALLFLVTSLPSNASATTDQTKLTLIKTITGAIAPKSVQASNDGLVSAHNMMYKHSITIYDAKTFKLLKTIPDSVSLKDYGFSKSSSLFRGAPVEGSFSPDGKYLYVSNYAMYGPGYKKEGTDTCSPSSGFDKSFIYRINRSNYQIDASYPVTSTTLGTEPTG